MLGIDPVVALRETRLLVEPGAQASTVATVRNPGTIVEQYELEVLGASKPWAEIVPRLLSLAPGGQADVQLVVRPPVAATTPAGLVPFGVRAASREDPQRADVAEGDLTVGAIVDLNPSLVAVAPAGSRSGRYRIELQNHGSVPLSLDLEPVEPEEKLSFALAPRRVEVGPGETEQAFVKVRVRNPFLLGKPTPHRFQVRYEQTGGGGPDTKPGNLDAVFEQRPILSRTLAVLAAAAVGLIGVALAFLLRGGSEGPRPGVPPPVPELGQIVPTGADRVQLVWPASALATGYRVQRLLPGTAGEGGEGEAIVEEQREVEGEVSAFTWDQLAPGTQYCFRLVALNDAGESQPTDPACVSTLAAAPFGAPADLQATLTEGGQVQLTWTAAVPTAGHTIFMDGTTLSEVQPGAQSATVTVTTAGQHCFTVLATQGEQASPPSEEQCVEIPPPAEVAAGTGVPSEAAGQGGPVPGTPGTPTATPTPGGGGTPTPTPSGGTGSGTGTGTGTGTPGAPPGGDLQGFYVVYASYPLDDIANQGAAEARTAELQSLGVPAELADSTRSEVLLDGLNGLWVIYWDGFESRQAALDHCAEYRDQAPQCYAVTPPQQ